MARGWPPFGRPTSLRISEKRGISAAARALLIALLHFEEAAMSDLNTQILIEIRDEIRGTNSRVDALNGRVDGVTTRLDSIDGRLESVEGHLESMEGHLESIDSRLDAHEKVLVRLHGASVQQSEALVKLVDLADRHEQTLAKVVRSLDTLNGRFDNFLSGAHRAEHEEVIRRVDDIDARVKELETRPKRRA
jgi:chromosome segregation ATPase